MFLINHFTVVSLIYQPLSEREAEVYLVLIENVEPFLMEIMLKKIPVSIETT